MSVTVLQGVASVDRGLDPSRRGKGPRSRAVSCVATICVAIALAGAPAARAQVSPHGDPFRVNGLTELVGGPDAGFDPQGGFVVVWYSYLSNGSDTDRYSIQMKPFDPSGTPLGDQVQVNAYTTGDQWGSAIAIDSGGAFVVVWESAGSFGSDTSGSSIQARRFDADGTPLGDEVQVNADTTAYQSGPAIALNAATGRYVVVWQGPSWSGDDTDGLSIQARLFEADGTPLGDDFQVNDYTTGSQRWPAVAMDDQGGFVVAWTSAGSNGGDTDGQSIQARRFDADGTPLGGDFQVNSYTTSVQRAPDVARAGSGEFVVAWESFGSAGTDSDGGSIQSQRFGANGQPLGGELQVNATTADDQVAASAAWSPQGDFVVSWLHRGTTPYADFRTYARRFRSDGSIRDGEFRVDSPEPISNYGGAAAMDPAGDFLVLWVGGGPGRGRGVEARLYDGLFRDGFESGDTGRWSP